MIIGVIAASHPVRYRFVVGSRCQRHGVTAVSRTNFVFQTLKIENGRSTWVTHKVVHVEPSVSNNVFPLETRFFRLNQIQADRRVSCTFFRRNRKSHINKK